MRRMGRMLNMEIARSSKFQALQDDFVRLIATWMIPFLDKNGVMCAEPSLVRADLIPLREDKTSADVARALENMEDVGLISFFQHGGRRWLVWKNFAANQHSSWRPDREATTFPDPPNSAEVGSNSGVTPESVCEVGQPLGLTTNRTRTERNTNGTPLSAAEAAVFAGKFMPSVKSVKAKKAALERKAAIHDLTGYETQWAVKEYLSVFPGIPLTRENAAEIDRQIKEGDSFWGAALREWAAGNQKTGKTWNPENIEGILKLCASKRAQAAAQKGRTTGKRILEHHE